MKREVLTYFFLLLVVSFGLIWVRAATVKSTYRFVKQERQLRELRQEIQKSRADWMSLTSPKRLNALARNFGMHSPKPGQVLRYK